MSNNCHVCIRYFCSICESIDLKKHTEKYSIEYRIVECNIILLNVYYIIILYMLYININICITLV